MKQISFSNIMLSGFLVFGLSACSGYDLQNISRDEIPVDLIGGDEIPGEVPGGSPAPTDPSDRNSPPAPSGNAGGGSPSSGGGSTPPSGGGGSINPGVVVVSDGPDTGKPYCRIDHEGESQRPGRSNNARRGNEKILVCHVPPGNPAAAHNILISEQGWLNGHQPHHDGDYLGACGEGNDGGVEINSQPSYSPCD